jgi:hypothetical protein
MTDTKRINVGDWVEVASEFGDLPLGNRYQVTRDLGKALELKGLKEYQNSALFKKIDGPNAPRT